MIAAWCWDLIEPYLKRNLINRGIAHPTRRQILEEFVSVWPEFIVTIGVQEATGVVMLVYVNSTYVAFDTPPIAPSKVLVPEI